MERYNEKEKLRLENRIEDRRWMSHSAIVHDDGRLRHHRAKQHRIYLPTVPPLIEEKMEWKRIVKSKTQDLLALCQAR